MKDIDDEAVQWRSSQLKHLAKDVGSISELIDHFYGCIAHFPRACRPVQANGVQDQGGACRAARPAEGLQTAPLNVLLVCHAVSALAAPVRIRFHVMSCVAIESSGIGFRFAIIMERARQD